MPIIGQSFDYIVVGGGVAAAALLSRLNEKKEGRKIFFCGDSDSPLFRSCNNKVVADLMRASGHKQVPDYNEAIVQGVTEGVVGYCRQNNVNGQRSNPWEVLVEPILGQGKNMIVVVDEAHVHRITLNGTRATGVVFSVLGTGSHWVEAKKEVILCAGAINTPMLSGIGPSEHLEQHASVYVIALLKQAPKNHSEGSLCGATGFYKSAWSKKHEPHRGCDMQYTFVAEAPRPARYSLSPLAIP